MPEKNGIVINLETIAKVVSILLAIGGVFYVYITTLESLKYSVNRNQEHIEQINKKLNRIEQGINEIKKSNLKTHEDIIQIKNYTDREISRIWQFVNSRNEK